MSNILVSTDLTSSSDEAIKVALIISGKFNLNIKVVHIHKGEKDKNVSYLFPDFENRLLEMKGLFRENLETQLEKHLKKFKQANHIVHGEILFTSDIDEFDELTERFSAQMVIVSKTNEEFDSYMGGAVSERLIRTSKQNVLIVSKPTREIIDHILVPFSLNSFSLKAIEEAILFANKFSSKITLVHLHSHENREETQLSSLAKSDEQTKMMEKINEKIFFLKEQNIFEDLRLEYCEYGKKEKLLTIIHQINPGLVVMGASRKKGLERFYLGSFCEFILRNGNTNILITKK